MQQLQNAHTTQWVICKKAITTKTPLPYFLTVTEKKIHTYLLPLYSPVSCLLPFHNTMRYDMILNKFMLSMSLKSLNIILMYFDGEKTTV